LPDLPTIQVYALHAEEFAAAYNAVRPSFLSRLSKEIPAGGRVLDIGSGSGRDMAAFAEEGFDVYGVEPAEPFIAEAERQYPDLKGRIRPGSLPDGIPPELGTFDAVHCSAVLMHLAKEELFNAIFTMRDLLRPDGLLHLAFSLARPGLDAEHRSAEGRLFNEIDTEQLKAILRRAGFKVLSESEGGDNLGRDEIKWVSLVLKRLDGASERPLQRIEVIVNHDNKDATYKLALLRSLAELAETHFHEAKWLGEGMVGIPVNLVVDKWIRYYWPLFESNEYIAQKNGEHPGCGKPLMFRSSLTALIDQFRNSGSFLAYLNATEQNANFAKETRTKIRDAIRNGPVKFASGNIFGWSRVAGESYITMPNGFWEELGELSNWIEPAIRLQWAEETRRFAKESFQTGEILHLLSTDYEQLRSVTAARNIFGRIPMLHCTWTGDRLGRSFDIDHIIPYSLWHNNDLWNLVPANSRVNNQKRDKLVERNLLYKQRDLIVHAWELQRQEMPLRFDRELGNLVGRAPDPENWEAPAFNRLAEAIEATALRRQVARWSA
jgi:SAM-dependent methyltransferase